MLEMLLVLLASVATLVVVPAVLIVGGCLLAGLLGDERPERFLDDPSARRRALIGR
jgi:hypothetical protein